MGKLPRFENGNLQCLYVGVSKRHFAELTGSWRIELSTGREIELDEIRQYRTYAGLLEGLVGNVDENIEYALELANDAFPEEEAPPALIPPTVLHGHMRTRSANGEELESPWWSLPEIATIARFNSSEPAKDQKQHASSLVLVWFQSQWGIPSDPALIAKIKELDWDALAWDWMY